MSNQSVYIYKAPNIIDIINHNKNNIIDIYDQIDDINDNIDLLNSVITAPKISYPSQAIYNSTINLIASSSITAFKDNGSDIDKYIWLLPDDTILEGNTISYTMPNSTHIGEFITIKCRAKDILGNYSKYTNIDILISNTNDTPIIDDIFWNNENHNANNNYTLTILAHSINNTNDLIYEIFSNDNNISITQDTNNNNIFTIIYPSYNNDVIIDYTIKVTDIINNTTYTYIINSLVYHNNNAPIIDNITWNNAIHNAGNTYILSIEAHDPNINNILSYYVSSNDNNISIVQDTNNKNIFTIIYPNYNNDTVINYTITVINNNLVSSISNISHLVHNNNEIPIIDSISWDNDDQYENNSYILTINAHSINNNNNLDYELSTSNQNINIVQDSINKNIFTITYPEYDTDTIVNYVIKVIDDNSLTISNLSCLVKHLNYPPIINDIFWDNDIQKAGNSYTLTIDAEDPNNNDILNYEVICNDNNVNIVQDINNKNIFTITYPDYQNDVTILYNINVIDNNNLITSNNITQFVNCTSKAPIIDGFIWDNDIQKAGNTYNLTISAHSLDTNDILNYKLISSDSNISIVQDTNNKNIFIITYPNYSIDIAITYTITVINNNNLSSTSNTIQLVHNNNQPPIINSIFWNDDIQKAANSYTLTIDAINPNDFTALTYELTCDDPNVSIVQDTTNNNIFTITYPDYLDNILVNYIIKITDNLDLTTIKNINKFIHNNDKLPIINNISWDNDDHYENNSYTLTINAYDPNSEDDLIYELFTTDNKISIVQDTINKNVFTIIYRDYSIDTIANLIVKITDNHGNYTIGSINHLVKHYNELPIINSISWDNNIQYGKNTYILTIDAYDPDNNENELIYDVICNDKNVSIIQDIVNLNQFTITYPSYDIDTTINYTIKVTDIRNGTTISTITQNVLKSNVPPIINNISWNNNIHNAASSYLLIIDAEDPNIGNTLNYNVIASDPNIIIEQDTTNINIFTITYPDYLDDTVITYIIEVTDNFNISTSTTITHLVINNDQPPIIDSISWDNNNQYEDNKYILSIDAHDPNNSNTLTYKLTSIDNNIIIVQNTNNYNMFNIVYPKYNTDTIVNFTIEVIDNHGKSSISNINQLVKHLNRPPIINNISWNNDIQKAAKSYILNINASDPNSEDILNYEVNSSDNNISIVQDTINKNIFTITYPNYQNDIVINYTITVTDNNGLSVSDNINQLVYNNNNAPIIDNISWDSNNQYENNNYILTIDAHDIDDNDILNYEVTSSDTNISIIQDTTNLNKFTITYPFYTIDTTVNFIITVTDDNNNSTVSNVSHLVKHINHPPIINNIFWDNNTHNSNGTYILTIDAYDSDFNESIVYDVICNDPNVSIVQDTVNLNKFTITYPEYLNNTTLLYTITVTDNNNISTSNTINQLVNKINKAPIISNIYWNNDVHNANNNYMLIIEAYDPNNDTLSYEVNSSDNNISIVQDTNNKNIFTIYYPDYTIDATIDYIITVTDNYGLSTIKNISHVVYNNNQTPIINSVSWNDDNQFENNSYTLTIDAEDPNNDILTYKVTSSDTNINITQDINNKNIFTITYPSYSVNNIVNFTIEVTDNLNNTIISDISHLVKHINNPPIIDNVSWSNNIHIAKNSYVLTITAHDIDDNDTLSYEVTCNDTNISIIQNIDNKNIFTITYPEYLNDTNIEYTIAVTDTYNETTFLIIDKTVNKINEAPIINKIYWDNSVHSAGNNYTLTIDAEDPNNDILSYEVNSSDSNISIVQDITNKNIFTITYPNYRNDILITYTITVNDNHGLSTSDNINQYVKNNNDAPIINNVYWNNINQYENNSYILTISAYDPNNDALTYEVTSLDNNIIIEQDTTNENIFHITYPDYTEDTVVNYTIKVTDSYNRSAIFNLFNLVKRIDQFPIIDNLSWNNNVHNARNSYDLTIIAHDPDNPDVLSYIVESTDNEISIVQDTTELNIFHITYPNYINDTIVTYNIKVTDINNNATTASITHLVYNNDQAPIINSVSWNDDNQFEDNSYVLTINASDLDTEDILNYNVTSTDNNIIINQNTNNINKFNITYPIYNIDTVANFNVIVTDNHGKSSTSSINHLVKHINKTPIINNISWNDDIQKAANSYILTIDAEDPNNNDTIFYSVTCDDNNVFINQDTNNKNIFTITYPNYNNDVVINYTITVSDNYGLYDINKINHFVYNNNNAPIIDSISWDNDNQFENNSYILTIDAHDPNSGDILYYEVTSLDTNINITQNTTNKNIFTIIYPNYNIDTIVNFSIVITDNANNSTITDISHLVKHINNPPIIDNIFWDNNIHNSSGTYVLTIDAHDTDLNNILNYNLICSDPNVSIVQNTTNLNIFTITYPEYLNNTTLLYTITVTDDKNLKTIDTINQTVVRTNKPPIINSIIWNNDVHNAANSYTLTIDAIDPNNGDILDYNITCNDTNINIIQDTNSKNIFTITYPDYTTDVTIDYIITITDNYGLSTVKDISHVVYNNNQTPIINSVSWNDDNQFENNSYTLTIDAEDPNNDILSYELTCNDTNVNIIQDTNNKNIFTITYPNYNIDTTINYTISVTDTNNNIYSVNISHLVKHINNPPIIDNVSWNNNTHNSKGSYSLTINAHDPDDNNVLSYEVICNDSNVSIVQDITNENIFHITYPFYDINTSINYTIIVTDNYNAYDSLSINKLINHSNSNPIINNIFWNNSVHSAANSYILTIDAEDPNNDILNYEVNSSDSNINIVQNTTNKNIFTITYPNYRNDIVINYIITVTDNHGLSTTSVINQFIENNDDAPIIDSVSWDNDNQFENNNYTLTIDAHDLNSGDILYYDLISLDNNVNIIQDTTNKNIFHITYPNYNVNKVVNYIIKITDNYNKSSISEISHLVKHINNPPIIDNISWNNNTHNAGNSYILTITAHDTDDNDILSYEITCNDANISIVHNTSNSNKFTITYPDYINDITITYYIKVTDINNTSATTYITHLVHNNNKVPIIDGFLWDNDTHYSDNTYKVNILAHDQNDNDNLTYNLICNDNNVTITQDTTDKSLFIIVYPHYNNNTIINYTATITDSNNTSTTSTIPYLVHINNTNPIINSITWNNNDQIAGNTYTMTISANDPDINNTLSYEVICNDDNNINIEQNTSYKNKFNITYPDYSIDKVINFNIIVTDNHNAFTNISISQLVHNNNRTHILDSTIWNSNKEYEKNIYVVIDVSA